MGVWGCTMTCVRPRFWWDSEWSSYRSEEFDAYPIVLWEPFLPQDGLFLWRWGLNLLTSLVLCEHSMIIQLWGLSLGPLRNNTVLYWVYTYVFIQQFYLWTALTSDRLFFIGYMKVGQEVQTWLNWFFSHGLTGYIHSTTWAFLSFRFLAQFSSLCLVAL